MKYYFWFGYFLINLLLKFTRQSYVNTDQLGLFGLRDDEYPSIVHIEITDNPTTTRGCCPRCSGVLISLNRVLTVARCLWSEQESQPISGDVQIYAGTSEVSGKLFSDGMFYQGFGSCSRYVQKVKALRIIYDKKYNPSYSDLRHGIALIIIPRLEPNRYIQPIDINYMTLNQFNLGKQCQLVGFGINKCSKIMYNDVRFWTQPITRWMRDDLVPALCHGVPRGWESDDWKSFVQETQCITYRDTSKFCWNDLGACLICNNLLIGIVQAKFEDQGDLDIELQTNDDDQDKNKQVLFYNVGNIQDSFSKAMIYSDDWLNSKPASSTGPIQDETRTVTMNTSTDSFMNQTITKRPYLIDYDQEDQDMPEYQMSMKTSLDNNEIGTSIEDIIHENYGLNRKSHISKLSIIINKSTKKQCTGTFLSTEMVITAASCLVNPNNFSLTEVQYIQVIAGHNGIMLDFCSPLVHTFEVKSIRLPDQDDDWEILPYTGVHNIAILTIEGTYLKPEMYTHYTSYNEDTWALSSDTENATLECTMYGYSHLNENYTNQRDRIGILPLKLEIAKQGSLQNCHFFRSVQINNNVGPFKGSIGAPLYCPNFVGLYIGKFNLWSFDSDPLVTQSHNLQTHVFLNLNYQRNWIKNVLKDEENKLKYRAQQTPQATGGCRKVLQTYSLNNPLAYITLLSSVFFGTLNV